MSIIIKSVESSFSSGTPESKVTFEVQEQIGAITRIVDTLSITIQGGYAIDDPQLRNQILLSLTGTPWAVYS